ncbi:CRISPR-associated protein, Cas6 family [Anaerobranca californiensis DSM 14826]|uniref:CRISPR-associated endoribonuclease n=1 Tax=Anaerobranca californiensis DSM 14826 TaxID=1120989 RepID=A0A1M6QKQ1_9FIRM|nr:CRISPR-associated endoribonuclease Cas6 [Anaerobranca californiensis]SHK20745.1 CRISPR-associated protein, Cas6 family [Anaerobranca californiensis DSM 14826]
MRLGISLSAENPLNLPIHYNHILQGFIYDNLADEIFRSFLHNEGFAYEKRNFKLFTFSKLLGSFAIDKEQGRIIFQSPVKLFVSSPVDKFINEFGRTLIEKETFYLGKNKVKVDRINTNELALDKNEVKIRTLSPIVVYSTVTIYDKKQTIYHKPGEEGFEILLKENLEKKYTTIFGKKLEEKDFEIKAIYPERIKMAIIKYKGTVIKGYSGDFILKGNPELIKLAYDTGLGSKNSQGFGCIEVI